MEKQRDRRRSGRLDLKSILTPYSPFSHALHCWRENFPHYERERDLEVEFAGNIEDSISDIMSLERSEDSRPKGEWWSR